MKKLLMILPIVLVFCLSTYSQVSDVETSSNDLEKELRGALKQLFKAWDDGDLDTMAKIEGDVICYGYRTPAPRLIYNEKLRKFFYSSMEIFETNQRDDPTIRVIGDVGLVLGTFTEKFKRKGDELESIEGRFSMTFIRVDGKWKLALYHRDVQFDK
jgi:hypothetical protein